MTKLLEDDGCKRRDASRPKTASGITVYLLDGLTNARLWLAELKKYCDQATELVEKSEHKDHFFEVGGHLIYGIPETLQKLEKSLDAAAMAAARMDYEEVKNNLRPAQADELEEALEDVRLRYLNRRGQDDDLVVSVPPKQSSETSRKEFEPMTPKDAGTLLDHIANTIEQTGTVPVADVMALIAQLEPTGNKTAAMPDRAKAAGFFREMAKYAANDPQPSRVRMAAMLRRVVGDSLQMTGEQVAAAIYTQSNSREEVMKGFKRSNPSMSESDLENAADMWEKHKDNLKGA